MFDSGLMIDRASIHGFYKLHNRVTKIGSAVENGGLDRGGAAVSRKKGRVKIENAFGLEELEEVGFN